MKTQTDIDVGTRVSKEVAEKNCYAFGGGYRTIIGTVIYNRSRQGDQVVIVEWDEKMSENDQDFPVEPYNINDLTVIEEIERPVV